jgi:hypothetical protein
MKTVVEGRACYLGVTFDMNVATNLSARFSGGIMGSPDISVIEDYDSA